MWCASISLVPARQKPRTAKTGSPHLGNKRLASGFSHQGFHIRVFTSGFSHQGFHIRVFTSVVQSGFENGVRTEGFVSGHRF
jgi:hypothetical protein